MVWGSELQEREHESEEEGIAQKQSTHPACTRAHIPSTALKNKTATSHISDEGPIFRMCNVFLRPNNKTQTAQF